MQNPSPAHSGQSPAAAAPAVDSQASEELVLSKESNGVFWPVLRTQAEPGQRFMLAYNGQTTHIGNDTATPPIPGQFWPEQHGFYAGIMPALDGQGAYHLILDPADLIAADGSAEHEWGPYGQKIAGADSLTDGLANTIAMRQAASPALAALDEQKTDDIPFHNYYIPSKREMALIVATCSEHMTAGELYWTSSQYSALTAWCQSFNLGDSYWLLKYLSLRVRPVRRLFL